MSGIEFTPEEESSSLSDYDSRRLQAVYAAGIERIQQMITAGTDDPGALAEIIKTHFVLPSRGGLRYEFLTEWARLQNLVDDGEIDETGFSIGIARFCNITQTRHLTPMEILTIGEAHRVEEISIRALAAIFQRNKDTIQKAVRAYDKRQKEVKYNPPEPLGQTAGTSQTYPIVHREELSELTTGTPGDIDPADDRLLSTAQD